MLYCLFIYFTIYVILFHLTVQIAYFTNEYRCFKLYIYLSFCWKCLVLGLVTPKKGFLENVCVASSSVQITKPILTEFALKPLFWTNKYSREIILNCSENRPLFRLKICNISVLVYLKKLCSYEFDKMFVKNKS